MADTINTKLQVKIYQVKDGSSTFTGNISEVATPGVIVFDEYTQKIGINGKWFGIDDLTTYNALKATVNDISSKVGNDSVVDQISNALATALGSLTDGQLNISSITLGENVDPTVENYLKALQAAISANTTAIGTANTNISDLQSVTATDGTGSFVVRDKNTGEGHTDFENTTDIQAAINTAESNAETFATDADTALKGAIEGTASKTIPVTTGSGDQASTTNVSFNDNKSIGYLWDLVSDAYGKIDTLGGEDLASVQEAIAAIKQELMDGSEAADLANTLIDKLKTFLGGVTSWDVDGDNTNNATTVAQIIEDLKTYASSLITNLDATVSQSAGADGLALSLTEVDGVVTAISGSIAPNTYDAHGAAAAVLGTSGDASTANTVYGAKAYTDGAKSDVIGTSGDASTANTVYGAKAYADSVAASAANSSVSWTVVTGTES